MKTKILKNLILLTVLCVCVLAVGIAGIGTETVYAADSGMCGDNLTWTLDDDGVLTISGTGAMTDYDATTAGASPWKENTEIKSVVIADGVTSIGSRAFVSCTELTSVVIPNSVTSIGANAFYLCNGLTTAAIPDGVTSIGEYAFYSCKGLTTVTIPTGVTSIGQYTFAYCVELTELNIGSKVKSIGLGAFFNCSKLTSVTIPNSVTSIAGSVFRSCSNLTSVSFEGNAPTLGTMVFYNAPSNLVIYVTADATGYDDESWSGYNVIKPCNIVFEMNDLGDAIDGQTVYQTYTATKPDDPTAEGHTFGGWYTDATCTDGNEFDFDTPITDNITLYAKWTHSWAEAWSADATHHWHECTVEGCPLTNNTIKSGYGEHAASGVCECGAVVIDENTFPDANFRKYLLTLTYGKDGIFTPTEIAATEGINAAYYDISDLTGIEHFPAITLLRVTGNNLTTLDISNNKELTMLIVGKNQLTSIDVSEHTKLTSIDVTTNNLTSLDVSNNTALTQLDVSNNNLTSLDLRNNTELTRLFCYGNQLTSLDLSKNTLLKVFECQNNNLTNLDLSVNTQITTFDGSGQTASITIDDTALSVSLPAGVTAANVAVVFGATLNDEAFEAVLGDTIVYTYATGLTNNYLTVTLTVTNPHTHTDADSNYTCDVCGTYLGNFKSIAVSLGKDITVKYYTAGDLATPKIRFTINGYTKTVSGTLTEDGAQYEFVFDGVAPQWIGDNIKAELLVNGEVIEIKNYSVLTYLNALKAKNANDLGYSEEKYNAMITLINDLLVYGGAAQTYTEHNTNNLVSAGITGTTFETLTETDKSVSQGKVVTFAGATVFFDSTNHLRFYFTATDLADVTFTLKKGDGVEQEASYVASGDSYLIKTDDIYATGFDDVYTLTVYYNETTDATFVYSVKSYVYAKQNDTNANAALARATYNYGLSAQAFVAAQ